MVATTVPDLSFPLSDREVLRRFWHPIAFSKDVAGTPCGARLLDVHLVAFGNPDWTLVPEIEIERTEVGLRFDYEYAAGNSELSPLGGEEAIRRTMHYELALPFSARLVIAYDDGRRDVVCIATAPA